MGRVWANGPRACGGNEQDIGRKCRSAPVPMPSRMNRFREEHVVKHTWCILCVTLAVAGCSQSRDDGAGQSAAAIEQSDLGASTSLTSDECGLPTALDECGLPGTTMDGDECGSPAALETDDASEAVLIDDADEASPPPSFVPPLTISAISRSQGLTTATAPSQAVQDSEETESDADASASDVADVESATSHSESIAAANDSSAPALLPTFTGLTESDSGESAPVVADGFTQLIAADDTLAGWEVVDGKLEAWEIDNGTLRCLGAGGGWLQTANAYSDFILRGEYRLTSGANTGVAVRFPGEGDPSLSGIEIQLLDETAEKYADVRDIQRTGSLYYLSAATAPAIPHPAGEWNSLEITCQGRHIRVSINGLLVNDVLIESQNASVAGQRLATRAPLGHIALQSHEAVVEFRSLEVLDLSHETESGLRIVEISEGTGDVAEAGTNVTVHYVGQLLSGAIFDDSYHRGEAVTVPIDRVILGWREGIQGMKVGGRRRLIVPPQLAYGENGVGDVIPPDSTLVFEVELLAVATADTVVPDAAAAVDSGAETQDAGEAVETETAAAPPTTEISTQLTSPPTVEASQSHQMEDPLGGPDLFEGEAEDAGTLGEPLTLPPTEPTSPQASSPPQLQPTGQPLLLPTNSASLPIAPASSTQPGEAQPLNGPALGPSFE